MTNKPYHHRSLQLVATLWLLVCGAAFLVYSLANPIAEWDMLAYAASAEAIDGTAPEEIHKRVYAELKEHATATEYEAITSANSYRKTMYEDAQAFNEQLPYYKIRIAFITLVKTLRDLGVNIYDAGHYVAALAFILSLLLLWASVRGHIHPVFQLALPLAFYKYTRDLEVLQQILADSLSSVWVVLICIAYLRESRWLLPLIAFSVFIRVDLAVFSGLMLLMLFATGDRKNIIKLFVCGVVLVASFLFIQNWAGSYGWKTLYYFAIISDMLATHPTEYSQIGFTFNEYLNSLVDTSRWISPMFGVSAAFSFMILLIWMFAKLGEYNKRVSRISIVCALYIAAHYLIFPQLYLRFFVSQNMMIFAGFSILLTHYWHVYLSDRRNDVREPGKKVTESELSDEKLGSTQNQ